MHGTQHRCKFLPKFHPELNPIERVWSRMKWHIRKYCDGSLQSLEKYMNEGLAESNLSLSLIRKYCRLISAYYYAYLDNMNVVQADEWIRKHRTHRGFAPLMDELEEVIDILPVQHEEIPEEPDLDLDDPEMWMEMLIDIEHVGNM